MKNLLFSIFLLLVIGGGIVYVALTDANIYISCIVLFITVFLILYLYSKTDLSKEENTRIIPCDASIDIKRIFDKIKGRTFKQWERFELKKVLGVSEEAIAMESVDKKKIIIIYKDEKAGGLRLRFSEKAWCYELGEGNSAKFSEVEKRRAVEETVSFMDIEDLTIFNALHCGLGNLVRDGKFTFEQQEWFKAEREDAQWPNSIAKMVRKYRHAKEWGEARNIQSMDNLLGAAMLLVGGTIILAILFLFDLPETTIGPVGGIMLVAYGVAVILLLRALIFIACSRWLK